MTTNKALNDAVENMHLRLIEDEDYRALLGAVRNEQAVEGSLFDDDLMAAKMIRERAALEYGNLLAQEKLAAIVKALKVVLRRYGMSRKQRVSEP